MITLDVIKSDGSSKTCTHLKKIIKDHSGKVLIVLKLILALLTFLTVTITINYIKVENNLQICQSKTESDKKDSSSNTTSVTTKTTLNHDITQYFKSLIQRYTNSAINRDTCWKISRNQCTNITTYKFLCFKSEETKTNNCDKLTDLCRNNPKPAVEVYHIVECHCIYTVKWKCYHYPIDETQS
uniref:Small hydrophobic protein n=1 Tax=human metapneumovirus TaxID=162145 RepID=M9V3Y2_9MONO|nr:small hydrophobic protein [Human metapneumovirus]